jgi:hypothetical protein
MKKVISYILLTTALVFSTWNCKSDKEFLEIQPLAILTNDQVFSEPAQVLSVLADLYNRQVDFSTTKAWASMTDFSESFPSEDNMTGVYQNNSWGYGTWGIDWFTAYAYIRELNLFLVRCEAAQELALKNQTGSENKKRFLAEARFLRANFYFELTKRYGGVPLILQSLEYDRKGDPTYLRNPRAKEAAMYDFIISEVEAIKGDLPKVNSLERSRASMGAALAMQCRAALYAGSIAKYGATTPSVSLPGGEIGIPASQATGYYTKALEAARAIIAGEAGSYSLYQNTPTLSDNFANLFLDKTSPESIFIEDFRLKSGKTVGFTLSNQPQSRREEDEGGRLNPSLNLVMAFEKTDGTFGPLPINDAAGNPIYYTNQQDLFVGRDARLAGTVLLPGAVFKGAPIDIWAGYQLADGTVVTGGTRGELKTLPGTTVPVQVVGNDGPINGVKFTAQTGFYVRKYLDPAPLSGTRGTQSEAPFIRYRYAEVLLNAAEAAFELGQTAAAVGYINPVRKRAGVKELTQGELTFDRIVHERRVELAFEGHNLFDMKRWRLAEKVWDGVRMSEADVMNYTGGATQHNTQPYSLWPYKYYNPASPNNGKWFYKVVLLPAVTGTNRFQLGNYYTNIGDNVINNNPLITRQPNQQ